MLQARTLSAGGMTFSGGPGDMFPREIRLSKMQFPAFAGPELVSREGLLTYQKMLIKNIIFDLTIITIGLWSFALFLHLKELLFRTR